MQPARLAAMVALLVMATAACQHGTTEHRGNTAASCRPHNGDAIYRLGGEDTGSTLKGNPTPVRGTVRRGSEFLITAHYAHRALSVPQADPALVRLICAYTEPRSMGGADTGAIYEGLAPGVVQVEAATNDCGPCMGLYLTADITITR